MAKLARAVGVSTASPYRHFADRDALLAAVAAQAATELAERIRGLPADDPRERLARVAGTYVRYVAERGAGLDVIFAVPDRSEAARALMDLLLDLAREAGQDTGSEAAVRLLERHLVLAHGYVSLQREEFFRVGAPDVEDIAERATEASRALLRGAAP